MQLESYLDRWCSSNAELVQGKCIHQHIVPHLSLCQTVEVLATLAEACDS